jgi:hypothetical protein
VHFHTPRHLLATQFRRPNAIPMLRKRLQGTSRVRSTIYSSRRSKCITVDSLEFPDETQIVNLDCRTKWFVERAFAETLFTNGEGL